MLTVVRKWLGWSGVLPLALSPVAVRAQGNAVEQAAATIHAAALETPLAALTADSLRDRPTPSAALDRAAAYVADELRRLGFRPGIPPRQRTRGDSTWIIRYTLPGQRHLDYAASSVRFVYGDDPWKEKRATVQLDQMAHFAPEVASSVIAERVSSGFGGIGVDGLGRPDGNGSSQVTLVAGPHDAKSLPGEALTGLAEQVVIYVPPAGGTTATARQTLERLYETARGVVILRATDSITFVDSVMVASRRPMPIADWYMRWAAGARRWPWAIDVWPGAVAEVLAAAGVDIASTRGATTPIIRHLDQVRIKLDANADTAGTAALTTAPVVAAFLPGTDARVADQYMIVATHIDTPRDANTRTGTPASSTPGINAAGLLALARALSDSASRPRRPVLLVATSGEAGTPAAWGAHFLAEAPNYFNQDFFGAQNFFLAFDLEQPGLGDSLSIDGAAGLALAIPPAWLAAKYPMPGMLVVDRASLLPRGSSASAFAHAFVPGLAVNGSGAVTGSGGAPVASEGTIGALRHVYYWTYEFANMPAFPRWTKAGRSMRLPRAP